MQRQRIKTRRETETKVTSVSSASRKLDALYNSAISGMDFVDDQAMVGRIDNSYENLETFDEA